MNSPHPARRRRIPVIVAATTSLAFTGLMAGVAAPPADAADAVPDVAKLAGKLSKQKLNWGECEKAGDRGPTIQCAMVEVPRDWKNPGNGKTWKFEISYNKLNDPKGSRFKGAILGNPGGPGGSGLFMAKYLASGMPDLAPYYNFIGFNPRGIDAESRPSCQYTYKNDDPNPFKEVRAIGETCAADPDVKTISTEQTTYDMDFIRHLLGLPKLSYFGYSYGTWLGSWYSKLFSSKADLVVLDSALDVTQPTYQHDKEFEPWAFPRREKLWNDPYKARLAAGDRSADVSADADAPLPAATASESQQRSFLSGEKGSDSTLVRGAATDRLADLATLKKSGLSKRPTSTRAASGTTTSTLSDMSYMVRCNDGQYTQGENYWGPWVDRVAKELNGGVKDPELYQLPAVQCLSWRTQTTMPKADPKTYPKTIVIHAELDANTVWEHGSVSGFTLPNTRFLAVDNYGVHGVFPLGTEQLDRPVINFFMNGKLPSKRVSVSQGPPRSGEDVTYEYWKPFNERARHYGELVTDPWQKAGTPTIIPAPETGGEIVRKAQIDGAFREWVAKTYGPKGLDLID